jgi:glycosyltransferase involved in cell wall biosynthesis
MENPIKVIYTMFESTKIPDDWIEYLKVADKVLVPSRWCRDVFKKAGIDTEVVPLGYDDDIFTYKEKENKRKAKKVFNFIHYNAFNIRKGFLEVFKAFTEEFEKDEPVKLILKTTLSSPPIPIIKKNYPNIEIITEKFSEKELADLLHKSDCLVYPSRGEGFGMVPLEAMATGTPAIVPNAHGITEYFDKDCIYEVKVKEECPALYLRYRGEDVGKMVICDIEDLRKQMRWVYEHQDEAIEKGKKASDYVRQWTFRKTAGKLKSIIDGLYELPIKDKKNPNTLQLSEV